MSTKSLEEAEVERDVAYRRKLKSIFNKTIADFPTPEEFYQYEEYVEELIYNLTQGIDVEETQRKIEEYRVANSRNIAMNSMKEQEKYEEVSIQIREQKEIMLQKERDFQVCSSCEIN